MLLSVQVLEHVQQHLAGEIALVDLEDWLVSASWNMHQHADGAAQELVGAIELLLAEHYHGHLDDTDVEDELHMILTHGTKAPITKLSMLWLAPELGATPISSTFAEQPPETVFVFSSDIEISGETYSASGRTVTNREIVQTAS